MFSRSNITYKNINYQTCFIGNYKYTRSQYGDLDLNLNFLLVRGHNIILYYV